MRWGVFDHGSVRRIGFAPATLHRWPLVPCWALRRLGLRRYRCTTTPQPDRRGPDRSPSIRDDRCCRGDRRRRDPSPSATSGAPAKASSVPPASNSEPVRANRVRGATPASPLHLQALPERRSFAISAPVTSAAIHGSSFGRRLRRYARCRASTVLALTVGRDRESGVPDCAPAAADGPKLANDRCVLSRTLHPSVGTHKASGACQPIAIQRPSAQRAKPTLRAGSGPGRVRITALSSHRLAPPQHRNPIPG